MNGILFVPDSIGYIALTILGLVISLYLLSLRNKSAATRWFTAAFIFRTLFYFSIVLAFPITFVYSTAFLPVIYICVIFTYLCSIQFFYLLQEDIYPQERKITLVITSVIIAVLILLMIYDAYIIEQPEYYMVPVFGIAFFLFSIFMIVLLARKTLYTLDYNVSLYVRELFLPTKSTTKAYSSFTWLTVLLVILTLIVIVRDTGQIDLLTFNILLLLFSILLVVGLLYAFINYSGQVTGFTFKLSSTALAVVLAVLGTSGFLIYSSTELARESGNVIPANKTLLFHPVENGSYRFNTINSRFDEELGEELQLESGESIQIDFDFSFPFYGQQWQNAYIHSQGVFSFSEPLHTSTVPGVATFPAYFEDFYSSTPKIAPLFTNFNFSGNGKLYYKSDEQSKTITWLREATDGQPVSESVQLFLSRQGDIEFRYPETTTPIIFGLRGIYNGDPESISLFTTHDGSLDRTGGESASLVENYSLRYTEYSHATISGFILLIVMAAGSILIGFPLLFRISLIKPIHSLLEGMKKVDSGDLNVQLPVYIKDELGILAVHFNKMTQSLKRANQQITDYAGGLEKKVEERTEELREKNREIQRQASADRIRAEISTMRRVKDLQQITPLIWQELKSLNVPFFRCGVFIVNEANESVQMHLSNPDGKALASVKLTYKDLQYIGEVLEYWRAGTVFTITWKAEQLMEWTQKLAHRGQIESTEHYLDASAPPDSLTLHFVPFKQGMLYVGSHTPLTDDQLKITEELASAFTVAYTRYEDFQRLDEKNKELIAALQNLETAQEQLVQQEKLASLGQLTAGIAHEIKNPLNFVNNFSEVSLELVEEAREEVKEKLSADSYQLTAILDDIEANLRKIHEHGSRADSIVKSMLEHSRGGSGKKEPTDLNALVKEFTNLSFHGMRAGKDPFNLDIEFELDESIGEVPLIAEDFSRVILNLCNNGFDAMRSKLTHDGEPETDQSYTPKLSVRTHQTDNTITIEIEDNGPGISDDIKDKILQPFFTTKKGTQGTGLGLSITNDIIKAHGGSLDIKTVEGNGSVFIISLPTV